MSETVFIAQMAEKVAKDLFDIFKWKRKIVKDHSWTCVTPEEHAGKKDHPSDCVFYYRDPYDNEMKYINTDLKSYAKGTINSSQIRKAILSLSYAVNCAAYNFHWKNLFKPEDPHSVLGMLFVYNHCGQYDGKFDEIIHDVNKYDSNSSKVNRLDGVNKIYVISPQKIIQLYSIAKDVMCIIGEGSLPKKEQICFFHPNEVLNKNHFDKDYSEPATLEMLFSPWIILKHAQSSHNEAGYVIYYMKKGEEVEEFIYLLDALSYYQILNSKGTVRIKLVQENKFGALNLNEAIYRYFSNLGYEDARIKALQNTLVSGTLDSVKPQFSSIELGVIS